MLAARALSAAPSPRGIAAHPGRYGYLLRIGVLAYLTGMVLAPLIALMISGLSEGLTGLWGAVSSPIAWRALWLTFWTALCISLINAVLGTLTAWVLVRYRFPGHRLLSSLIDLPFAIPTLVAGIMLVTLLGPQSALGSYLAGQGIKVIFSELSIVLVLLFITLPFTVRAVEPVLMELDRAEEEAAATLGAGRLTIFVRIIFPPLLPAIVSGTLQGFSRAIAEFGSVVVVSGNIPFHTLTAPVYIYGEVEGAKVHSAAAMSVVLLAVAAACLVGTRLLQRLAGARREV